MKLEQFNPQNLKQVRIALQAKLDVLSEEFGVPFKAGNITYSDDTFKCGVTSTIVPDGMSKMQVDFDKCCFQFGLDKSDYGKTFRSGGESFKLVGLKPRSPKYSVVGEDVTTGKRYKFNSRILTQFKN